MPSVTQTEVKDGLLVICQTAEPNCVRLALHGELDLSNVSTLDLSLTEALASGRDVVIDLDKLEFLDSTGVSLLVTTLARPDAGKLSFLPSTSPEVTRLLEMTGLDARMGFSRPEDGHPKGPAA